MSHEKWAAIGIPGETRFLKLLFDPFSQNLIAQFYREIQDGNVLNSLYGRHVSEDRYHRISEETDRLSFEDPVLSPASSHLFVNVIELEEIDGKPAGYNWNSIRKIDITSNEVVASIDSGTLAVDAPYYSGGVSGIFGASADGEVVRCNVGLRRKTDEHRYVVDYFVANVSLAHKKCEIITKLNNMLL